MLDSLVRALGPTGTGALIGALTSGTTGVVLTVISGWITAASATERERRSRLFDEQKAVYAAYLTVVRHLQERVLHAREEAAFDDEHLIGQLEILASKRVRSIHKKLIAALTGLLEEKERWVKTLTTEQLEAVERDERITPDAGLLQAHERVEALLAELEAAMRSDLGVR